MRLQLFVIGEESRKLNRDLALTPWHLTLHDTPSQKHTEGREVPFTEHRVGQCMS